MKKIYLSSIVLILCVLIYPNIANAGLSEGCSAYTCLADQDYYAGDCKTHIETLNDCTNIPADGYQKAFNCTVGCTQSFIPLINWKPEVGKVWYSAGNVGIGTDTPSWKLHVEGTMGVVGDVLVQNNIDAMGNLQIDGSGRIVGDLKVEGNVGIGTSSPETKFHIKDSNNVYTRIENNTGNQSAIQFADSSDAGEWVVGIHGGDANKFKIAKSTALQTNTALTIDESLNVGIGTATPSAKLEVKADSGDSFKVISNGSARLLVNGNGQVSAGSSWGLNNASFIVTGAGYDVAARIYDGQLHVEHSTVTGTEQTDPTIDSLIVENNGDAAINIFTPTNNKGEIIFSSPTTGRRDGAISYDHNFSGIMSFTAGDSSVLHVGGNGGGRVGVGTSLPDYKLHVYGTMAASVYYDNNNTAYYANPSATSYMDRMYLTDTTDANLNDTSGVLRIGNVNGDNIVIDGNEINARNNGSADTLYLNLLGGTVKVGSGQATVTSDRRLKKDIDDLQFGLDEVLKMRPVSFNWKNRDINQKQLGFIAQEIQMVVPNVVDEDDGDENLLSNQLFMDYNGIIPILTKAIQEQQQIIEDLTFRIEALEK